MQTRRTFLTTSSSIVAGVVAAPFDVFARPDERDCPVSLDVDIAFEMAVLVHHLTVFMANDLPLLYARCPPINATALAGALYGADERNSLPSAGEWQSAARRLRAEVLYRYRNGPPAFEKMLAIESEYRGCAPNQSEEGIARWLRTELLPKFRAEPLPEPPLTDDDSIMLLGKSIHNQIAEFANTYAANGLRQGWIDYQSPPLILTAADGSGILARPTVSREFLCWEPSPERGSHVTLTEARMQWHYPVEFFLDQPDFRGDRNWNALVPISIFACLLCAARTLRSMARTLGAWVD